MSRGGVLAANRPGCSTRCPSRRPPRTACTSILPQRIERPRSPGSSSWAPNGSPTWTSGATSGPSCRTRKATSSAWPKPDERRVWSGVGLGGAGRPGQNRGDVLEQLQPTVEGAAGNHVQGDVGVPVVDPVPTGASGDDWEDDHAEPVHETGFQKRAAQGEA